MNHHMKPELSKNNCYYLEPHRYYELRHFAAQYPIWHEEYLELDGLHSGNVFDYICKKHSHSDRTFDIAKRMLELSEKMAMVEKACLDTDKNMAKYLLIGLTEGHSYEVLRVRENIPCGRKEYYKLLRKCMWHLHLTRN